MTDKPRQLRETMIDGKLVRIGDKVPLPPRKLRVDPASFVDDPATGPRGAFRNGRGRG